MDVIDKICDGNDDAYGVCLLLYLNDRHSSIYYLDYLNIHGQDIVDLVNKCCKEYDCDYISETIRYLRSGFLGQDTIINNIRSDSPINFIPRLLDVHEDWDHAYEDFTSEFLYELSKQNKNKGR